VGLYPVIMCGGSGTRLWPASRPDRPKQFIPLVGERSSFQETVLRAAPLGPLIIVAGAGHRAHLDAQLAHLGQEATLILEPQARDSAAAMAAAAAFIEARDPDGIAVVLSADHHIPDHAAFRAACELAAGEAAKGRIVTLGVKPTRPDTALGYIEPADPAAKVGSVAAFVEKPDAARAAAYVAKGYLWNSGTFVTQARTLLGELDTFAPAVADAARAAVTNGQSDGAVLTLGSAFLDAPKISIDFAVMEKTAKASVAPVTFDWADIGAWDSVLAASPHDAQGNSGAGPFVEAAGNLVHAPGGETVALVGVNNLAVVIQDGAVLVADLAKAQTVKAVGEAMKAAPPTKAPPFKTLVQARAWFDRWITLSALPLWWSLGADHENGGFREEFDLLGGNLPRRGRVQPRQAYAFASAEAAGWRGPGGAAAEHAIAFMEAFRRPDGLIPALTAPDGTILDDTAKLYDQAFALLAYASLGREADALAHFSRLDVLRHADGGWREAGDKPFYANPHMHLFEALLAWDTLGSDPRWAGAADEVATLCLTRFVDAEGGFLREYFDQAWAPAAGDPGRMVEPGHQFEWAVLLDHWGRARGNAEAQRQARRLYAAGLAGVDARRGVAVNGLWDDLSVRDGAARLWVQAEYLKAAITFGDEAEILRAARAVSFYLDHPVPGAWRDRMDETGAFDPASSPASTLYHLVSAWRLLCRK